MRLSSKGSGGVGCYKCIGPVAYQLTLLPKLKGVHDVFHVSMLRRYWSDPTYFLQEQPVELKENLSYEEVPVAILVKDQKVLRNKVIPLVQVLWKNYSQEKATWEREKDIRQQYPDLL